MPPQWTHICPRKIQNHVLGLAAEVEIEGTHAKARESIPIYNILIDMVHPQPPTPIQVDNTMELGFTNGNIKQKMSKEINMCYYWVQDQTEQRQFYIYWSLGRGNIGDYHTKNFFLDHHKQFRGVYLHNPMKRVSPDYARV